MWHIHAWTRMADIQIINSRNGIGVLAELCVKCNKVRWVHGKVILPPGTKKVENDEPNKPELDSKKKRKRRKR